MSGSELAGKSSVRSSNASEPPDAVRVKPVISGAGLVTETGVVMPDVVMLTGPLEMSVPFVRWPISSTVSGSTPASGSPANSVIVLAVFDSTAVVVPGANSQSEYPSSMHCPTPVLSTTWPEWACWPTSARTGW